MEKFLSLCLIQKEFLALQELLHVAKEFPMASLQEWLQSLWEVKALARIFSLWQEKLVKSQFHTLQSFANLDLLILL
jgi:hypothetical protein